MRMTIAVAMACTALALLLGVSTTGTMAQTPYGSQSQSAPVGLDDNPATMPNQGNTFVPERGTFTIVPRTTGEGAVSGPGIRIDRDNTSVPGQGVDKDDTVPRR